MHLHVIRIARMYGIQLVRTEHITGVSSVSSWTRLPAYAHRAQSGPLHDRFTHFCHPCWRPRLPPPIHRHSNSRPDRAGVTPITRRTYRTDSHARMHSTHISSHTRTQTYADIHARTHTHKHKHTLTHTQTHTYTPIKNDFASISMPCSYQKPPASCLYCVRNFNESHLPQKTSACFAILAPPGLAQIEKCNPIFKPPGTVSPP